MSASITVEWPGATEDQQADHPGFRNDTELWSNWMGIALVEPKLLDLLMSLGADVLLHHNTPGLSPGQIGWAEPGAFERAATMIRDLVASGDARVAPLVAVYREEWDRIAGEGTGETAEQWFIRDLEDVAGIARYARSQGARQMTLGYAW